MTREISQSQGKREDLRGRLHKFNWPTSRVHIHNEIALALQKAGGNMLKAHDVYELGIFEDEGIPNIDEHLDVREVLKLSRQSVVDYLTSVEEVRNFLDRTDSFQSTSLYPNIPPGVIVRQVTLEWNLPDKPVGWEYIFNPYQVIVRNLSGLIEEIETLAESDLRPVEKLHILYESSKRHDDCGNFVSSSLLTQLNYSPKISSKG